MEYITGKEVLFGIIERKNELIPISSTIDPNKLTDICQLILEDFNKRGGGNDSLLGIMMLIVTALKNDPEIGKIFRSLGINYIKGINEE